jgi:hypothetical protein
MQVQTLAGSSEIYAYTGTLPHDRLAGSNHARGMNACPLSPLLF